MKVSSCKDVTHMLPKNLFRRPKNALEDADPSVVTQSFACTGCKRLLSDDELVSDMYVCRYCGEHMRIGARKRIALLFDDGSFEETNAGVQSGNPLEFPEYEGKLEKARAASNESESVITGFARLDGRSTAVFSMDPFFMMGSMGSVTGEKITRLFEEATERRLPVIGFTVSGGARMQEGILSLMQMAKTTAAVGRHSEAGLLYITVLTDPTTGGVDASFAMEGDIIIAEPNALIGFAGPRVIEQTIRQKLPAGFQRAEFQLEKGFVDMICDRREMKSMLSRLLKLHSGKEAPAQ